jgi:hypothetical protein
MKITIGCQGDPSVGYPGDCLEINWENITTKSLDRNEVSNGKGDWITQRQYLRETLEKVFGEIFEEPAFLVFGDECPECLGINGCYPQCENYQERR